MSENAGTGGSFRTVPSTQRVYALVTKTPLARSRDGLTRGVGVIMMIFLIGVGGGSGDSRA
jgi:hypothetical protein